MVVVVDETGLAAVVKPVEAVAPAGEALAVASLAHGVLPAGDPAPAAVFGILHGTDLASVFRVAVAVQGAGGTPGAHRRGSVRIVGHAHLPVQAGTSRAALTVFGAGPVGPAFQVGRELAACNGQAPGYDRNPGQAHDTGHDPY